MSTYHSYSDLIDTNHTFPRRLSNLTSSYSKFENENLNRFAFREKELLNKLELKNEENYKLRIDLENEIKSKDNLMYELDQLENELEFVKKRGLEREQSLNSKIRILEIEKNIMEERLNFRETRSEFYKGQLSDKRLELVSKFLNNVQKILIKPDDQKFLTSENLSENILNERFYLIESEIEKLTANHVKNPSSYENFELINSKLKELREDNDKLSKRIQELYEVFPEELSIHSPSNARKSKEVKKVREQESVKSEKESLKSKSSHKPEANSNIQRSKSKEKQLFYPTKDKTHSKK